MTKPLNHVFEFGPFRLETAERLLLRDEKPVPLTPKAFSTLLILVHNRGRLVEKDDLMKQVWPDAIVEEANLARNVWMLRRALGDDGEGHVFIETIPKVGYRFVAPVMEQPVETNGVPARELEAIADATGAPVTPTPDLPSSTRFARRERFGRVVLIGSVSLILMFVVLPRFLGGRARSAKHAPGATFLTDGSHDDNAASWIDSGQIYFSRLADARVETWTMSSDGADQHRANGNIKELLTGRWSPDGKKVIFVKDGDPRTAYLADADGTGEITLPFMPGNLDWSSDGSKFVYQAMAKTGTSGIFLYSLDTHTSTSLTSHPSGDADPSLSNDGTQVAFTSWRDGNPEIYIMNTDGSNVRRVTTHPAFDNYPVFSPDGTQIAFQSNRDDEHIEVYLQNLNDDSPPRRLTTSGSFTGLAPKCWSPDGTRMLVYTNQNGKARIELIEVEPLPAQVLLEDEAADLSFPRVSADGKRLLYEARLADRRVELRVTELDTKRTAVVFRTEPDYSELFSLSPAWSPDNSLIAFSARANGNSEIFTVAPDGSGLRNLSRNPLLDSSPVFSADGRELVFARDTYGRAQLYRMDTNGERQRRVTDAPGYEMSPAVSPDGVHLAFAGNRESQGLDILSLDLGRPADERVVAARWLHDVLPAFSPDGSRIVFIAHSDGNPEIYLVNADGTGLVRMTHTRAAETAPGFSRDGKRIVFSSNRAGRFAIYQIDVW